MDTMLPRSFSGSPVTIVEPATKILKVSDAMFVAAEAIVEMGKKVGIDIDILDVYKTSPETAALIATSIKCAVMDISKQKIEVIKD